MSAQNRSFDERTFTRTRVEWGLETGIESSKKNRLVSVKELHNFRRITHSGFTFYLSIIDTKHPKFIRITERGCERWRMRFNVFSTGFLAKWMPNTLVHIGEIHVYYDLISDRPKPWCDDFTFYYDYREVGTEIMEYRYEMMDSALRDSLVGKDQRMRYMLFLPIFKSDFCSPNKDLDDFMERQDVMLSQLEQMRTGSHQGNSVTFAAAIKGGVTHTQYLINLKELETQNRRTPYQRISYQRSINC